MEQKIHSLLCDGLDEPDRQEVLLMLARDEQARKLMTKMLQTQRASRAAFGYDRADKTIAESMPGPNFLLGKANIANRLTQTEIHKKEICFRHFRGIMWLWRIAAMFVISVSTYIAITTYSSSQHLQTQLAEIKQSIATPSPFQTLFISDVKSDNPINPQ